MDTSLLLVEKVATSTAIGLLIGLEREWAHKEPGVRSFTIATLLGFAIGPKRTLGHRDAGLATQYPLT